MSTLDLHRKESKGSGLGSDMMDALVEIHRVIYRGKQDLEAEGRILGWNEQGKEVRRVVERWFEGDCGGFTFLTDTSTSYVTDECSI